MKIELERNGQRVSVATDSDEAAMLALCCKYAKELIELVDPPDPCGMWADPPPPPENEDVRSVPG